MSAPVSRFSDISVSVLWVFPSYFFDAPRFPLSRGFQSKFTFLQCVVKCSIVWIDGHAALLFPLKSNRQNHIYHKITQFDTHKTLRKWFIECEINISKWKRVQRNHYWFSSENWHNNRLNEQKSKFLIQTFRFIIRGIFIENIWNFHGIFVFFFDSLILNNILILIVFKLIAELFSFINNK